MSFDLAIGSFRDGVAAPLSTDVLRQAFAALIVGVEPGGYLLQTGAGQADQTWLQVDTAAAATTGFSLNRPGSDAQLFEGLFSVLREPGVVLLVPGSCPPLVGSELTVAHLPDTMVSALGQPRQVRGAAEIMAFVRDA